MIFCFAAKLLKKGISCKCDRRCNECSCVLTSSLLCAIEWRILKISELRYLIG